MSHNFVITLNGRKRQFTSELSHQDAGKKADAVARQQSIAVPVEVAKVLDLYRNKMGLTYMQWGLLHFFAMTHMPIVETTGQQEAATPENVGGEIRKGVASQPAGPPPKETFERRIEDPGFGGTRDQWKRNRSRYDG